MDEPPREGDIVRFDAGVAKGYTGVATGKHKDYANDTGAPRRYQFFPEDAWWEEQQTKSGLTRPSSRDRWWESRYFTIIHRAVPCPRCRQDNVTFNDYLCITCRYG